MIYLFFQYFKMLAILVMSILLCKLMPARLRIMLYPYAYVAILGAMACATFLPSAYLQMGVIYLSSALLLNIYWIGKMRWKSHFFLFAIFIGYNIFSNLYATEYRSLGFQIKITGIFQFFIVGIMAGIYAVENSQLTRLSRIASIGAIICSYVFRHNLMVSGFDVSSGDRMSGDELNSNLIGLFMVAFVTFPLINIMKEGPKQIVDICLSGVAVVACSANLILSGSRNALLGLVTVLVGSVFFQRKNKFLGIILFLLVATVMAALLAQSLTLGETHLTDFSNDSGRGEFWRDELSRQSAGERVFGRGTRFDDSAMFTGVILQSNMHSMYVQILYEMGYVGVFLFAWYLLAHIRSGLRSGYYGRVSLVFLATSLACGLAESYPMRTGSLLSLLWGFSIGMLLPVLYKNGQLQIWSSTKQQFLMAGPHYK